MEVKIVNNVFDDWLEKELHRQLISIAFFVSVKEFNNLQHV